MSPGLSAKQQQLICQWQRNWRGILWNLCFHVEQLFRSYLCYLWEGGGDAIERFADRHFHWSNFDRWTDKEDS